MTLPSSPGPAEQHRWFRRELNGYTDQLASAGAVNANAMVREVTHGLASSVQRQRESMAAIETKYAPGNAAAVAGGVAGVGIAAAVTLRPSVSPFRVKHVPPRRPLALPAAL